MKKLVFLIIIMLSIAVLAQTPNWTGVKETNINVGLAYSTDIFTNGSGNHIIVQEENNLKYYQMNINGFAGTPVTIENSTVVSPSISGDADNIYITYGLGSQIRVKRSTNGGISWQLYIRSVQSNISYMECVFSNDNLHITYQRNAQVWYQYRRADGFWTDEQLVSRDEGGVLPRIIAVPQDNMVYFLYERAGTEIGKWRWYNVNTNIWSDVFEGYSLSNVYFSDPAGINIVGSNLIIYFSTFEENFIHNPEYFFNKIVVNRINNTLIYPRAKNEVNMTNKVYSTTTFDGVGNTAFYYLWWGLEQNNERAIWRARNENGDRTDVIIGYDISETQQPTHLNLSSAANEVHVVWKDNLGSNNGNNLRYKYDDQAPLTPANFQLTNSGSPYYHPYLSWSAVNEPDVRIKNNGLRIERSIEVNGQWSSWSEIAAISGTSTTYTDGDIINATGGGNGRVKYRIRSYDNGGNFSPYTSEIIIRYGISMEKEVVSNTNNIIDYTLDQNYPNPFNPSTSITYQIKDRGFVSLKVYDMLGKEIAELVNEVKESGKYSVNFDASNLPSSVYIYSLRVNDFIQNQKMTLLK